MKISKVFLIVPALLLSGCTYTGVVAGLGAAVGVSAAQEGGLRQAVSDVEIQAQINHLWFEYDVDTFRKLDMTVTDGRVLLTGVVQNPEHRVEAVRLAWQPKGVKQVINEITVADSDGLIGYARDAWISARLRSSIMFDKDVQSINYSIDTVMGTIYLMGFAQNRAELNRVIEKARTIPDVRRVVSYVRIAGENSKTLSDSGAEIPADQAEQSGYVDAQAGKPVPITPVKSEDITWNN